MLNVNTILSETIYHTSLRCSYQSPTMHGLNDAHKPDYYDCGSTSVACAIAESPFLACVVVPSLSCRGFFAGASLSAVFSSSVGFRLRKEFVN